MTAGAGRLAALLVAIAAAVVLLWPDAPQPSPPPIASTDPAPASVPRAAAPAPASTVARPVSPAEVNQQDRLTPREQRDDRQRHRDRLLIQRLPLTLDGVTIDVAGLSPGGRTLLSVMPGPRGPAHARRIYRRALDSVGDSGDAYRARIEP